MGLFSMRSGRSARESRPPLHAPHLSNELDLDDDSRLAWCEICQHSEYRGRWVALDACRYDDHGRAAEGAVVDSDEDLVELCERVRESDRKNCAILFAEED